MKIIVFGGSNSKNSINKKFAVYASTFFDGNDIEVLDLNDYVLPLFSVDLEAAEGIHENAIKFYDKIQSADLIIMSLAENNGSYTAAFKNLLDWMSRHEGKVFGDKKILLLSTSDGGRGGQSVMEAALSRLPRHGAIILNHYSFPKFYENFSEEEGITDEELKNAFVKVVEGVKEDVG